MADDRGPPVVLPTTGTCVLRFFKPTLHCDSWIPYVRAMGVLLVLVGTTVVVLLIVYVL
jgi:hypothetical protein